MDNLLSFIGLMKRAGAVAIGAENAYDAARLYRARLLLLASDASRNTAGAARNAQGDSDTPLLTLPYTKAELGAALGQKECAAMAVLDTGFAAALCEKLGKTAELELMQRRLAREKSRKTGGKKGPGKNKQ